MSQFKPMKGVQADLSKLKFPLVVLPKLDGVRAIIRNGVVLSSTLKPIPSKAVQEKFSHLEHYDGELILGSPTASDVYNKTVSAVMRRDGTSDIDFHAFDHVENPEKGFMARYAKLTSGLLVDQYLISSLSQLAVVEDEVLDQGYEGLILRDPDGYYKYGRSSVKEGLLLKLKRFIDAEFIVVGFVEQMHNENEATKDELGRSKRSSHKENKAPAGCLGALILKYGDSTFECGTGFSEALRHEIWYNQGHYLGQSAKIKYFSVGMKDLPRHPVFLGFRGGF